MPPEEVVFHHRGLPAQLLLPTVRRVCFGRCVSLYVDRGKMLQKGGGGEPVASKFVGPVDAFEFDEFEGSGEFVEDSDFAFPLFQGGMKYGYIG